MDVYAVQAKRTGMPLFAQEEVTRTEWYAVEAESMDEAAQQVIRGRHSVSQLADGVTVAVFEVGDLLGCWHGQYDKEPMNDDHTATDAQLVIARRLDLEQRP